MKTAVIHDWLTGMRGGERVLEEILDLVPNPTIFTLFHFRGAVSERIERHPIRTSFLQRLPLLRKSYRGYLPLFARAVESFDLRGFDLVVSSSHCVAKGAVPPPRAPHICYCHTPVRYAYDQFDIYFPRVATRLYRVRKALVARLRRWDVATAGRVNRFLANSTFVADRIRRYYGREATVLHPPVDLDFFTPAAKSPDHQITKSPNPYWLCVSALSPYKRLDRAIEAANLAGHRLIIVGFGPEEKRLRARAGPSVQFRGTVSPEELRELYRHSELLVQTGEEDFGMAAVEALACGRPVVAFGRGGALDVVTDGVNGVFYGEDSPRALLDAIDSLGRIRFNAGDLRESARKFAPEQFRERFTRELVELHARGSRV